MKNTVIPPEKGWTPHTWYIVEVSYTPGNPKHRSLFFTGFLNAKGEPSGCSGLKALNCAQSDSDDAKRHDQVFYLKALWPLCDEKGIILNEL